MTILANILVVVVFVSIGITETSLADLSVTTTKTFTDVGWELEGWIVLSPSIHQSTAPLTLQAEAFKTTMLRARSFLRERRFNQKQSFVMSSLSER